GLLVGGVVVGSDGIGDKRRTVAAHQLLHAGVGKERGLGGFLAGIARALGALAQGLGARVGDGLETQARGAAEQVGERGGQRAVRGRRVEQFVVRRQAQAQHAVVVAEEYRVRRQFARSALGPATFDERKPAFMVQSDRGGRRWRRGGGRGGCRRPRLGGGGLATHRPGRRGTRRGRLGQCGTRG